MKRLLLVGIVMGIASAAMAAPNITNSTQKGSLLIFPDIRIDTDARGPWNTLIRLENDGSLDVSVKCFWMDGNKNRLDFEFTLTRNESMWFDARTGAGTRRVTRFPIGTANGFDNPFLLTPPSTSEALDVAGPYFKGTLTCFAVDRLAENQVKWNHLSGTATVYHPTAGAYEYSAYAFFALTGTDLGPVGPAGLLQLDGVMYDACPLYQIGQFTAIP